MLLSNIKDRIGNWAQSYQNTDLCYCGWMDLHVDEPYEHEPQKVWTIEVVEIDPDAMFVHRIGGKFVIEQLSKGDIISFDYRKWHGLLPKEIAKSLDGKRYWKKCKEYTEFLKEYMPDTYYKSACTEQDRARILWRFL